MKLSLFFVAAASAAKKDWNDVVARIEEMKRNVRYFCTVGPQPIKKRFSPTVKLYTLGWARLKPVFTKPMQTIYQVKELGPRITNIEKFLKKFEIFENFLGSEIFEISQIRISLGFNRSQTKTSASGRF